MTLTGPASPSPRAADGRRFGWVPFAMLVVTLGIVFLGGAERSQFHRGANHDYQTSKTLAIAANLSAEDNYRLFHRAYPGPAGSRQYELYGRFPATAYLLLNLAVTLGGDDLRGRVFAARMLMLTLFCGTALLLYHALARLVDNRPIALAATLLAFSSQSMQYWGDAVGTEVSMSMFGVALGFHGVAAYALRRRISQLLVKIGAALLLGWTVFGVVLAFVVLGVSGEVARAWTGHGRRRRIRAIAGALARSRYVLAGLFAVLWAVPILAFNVFNEHSALAADTPITQSPALRSMLGKAYLVEDPKFDYSAMDSLRTPAFEQVQLHRVGVAVLPGVVSAPLVSVDATSPHLLLVAIGAGALAVCFVGLRRLRRTERLRFLVLPLSTLAASSFCWAVPMRRHTGNFAHEHEGMLYFGVAAVVVVLGALALPRALRCARSVTRAHVFAALGAGAAFAASVAATAMGSRASPFQDEVFADFQAIRRITRDATVFVVATGAPRRYFGARRAVEFFLSGRVWQYSDRIEESHREVALGDDGSVWHAPPYDGAHGPDFVLARDRFDIPALRTPDNGTVFAYDSLTQLANAYRSLPILRQAPVARDPFDIHLARRPAAAGGAARPVASWRSNRGAHELAYLREQCVEADIEERFFLHVLPTDATALPPGSRTAGFENLDFDFRQHGVRLAGLCLATLRLPAYGIDRVRTGQLGPDGERAWQVEFAVD